MHVAQSYGVSVICGQRYLVHRLTHLNTYIHVYMYTSVFIRWPAFSGGAPRSDRSSVTFVGHFTALESVTFLFLYFLYVCPHVRPSV